MDELEGYAQVLLEPLAHDGLVYLAHFELGHWLGWLTGWAAAVLLRGLCWLRGQAVGVNNLVV